jgi:hypothetical protein
MKKALLLAGFLAVVLIARFGDVSDLGRSINWETSSSVQGDDVFAAAFAERRGNFVAEGSGTVTRILTDDNEGSRHQRFIVELGSDGQRLDPRREIDIAMCGRLS